MHGFIASAENWLLKSEKSLAFLLADNGFDVWLGNARGNRHSRRHKTLNPDTDEEFWNFSYVQRLRERKLLINMFSATTKSVSMIYRHKLISLLVKQAEMRCFIWDIRREQRVISF